MGNSKRIMLMAIVVSLFIVAIVGVTFAFFNYTRTGAPNTIRTGQIFFSFEQDNSLNITNMFPISSSELENSNIDTITVGIKGNTTYYDGEEFVISIVDVERGINSKNLPITYNASYEPADNKSIGSPSNDYWNDRNDKNGNIYLLNETGNVREGSQILVGYVDNEGSGIEGTLTIKAFTDSSRMVISDTYPSGKVYQPVENLSGEKLETCAVFFADLTGKSVSDSRDFCNGVENNNLYGDPIKMVLYFYEDYFEAEEMDYLLENGIIEERDNGTTSAWVDGRTVFTTSEWNSFHNNPVSFKIKAESNEGIWVEDPSNTRIESCLDCKFLYSTDTFYTVWNKKGETPSVINSELSDNYLDVIDKTNRDYFLGVKLNSSNQVTNIYACGIKNNVPFCIEGTSDGSKYNDNSNIMKSPDLWGNNCIYDSYRILCGSVSDKYMYAYNRSIGYVGVGFYFDDLNCWANQDGVFSCDHYYEY